MSLDAEFYGQEAEQELDDQIERGEDKLPPGEMSAIFEALYADYAEEGECEGVDISAGGDESVLEGAFISDNTEDTIEQLADAICDFWGTFDTEGEAQVLDIVTAVEVKSEDQKPEMKAAIERYVASGDDRSGWVGFFEATESVVKQIEFLVTEQDTDSGSTTVFTRFVS